MNSSKYIFLILFGGLILNSGMLLAKPKPQQKNSLGQVQYLVLGTSVTIGILSILAFLWPSKRFVNENAYKSIAERIQYRDFVYGQVQKIGAEEYVRQNYISYGNTDVNEAEIIFIGERHSNWKSKIKNQVLAGSLFETRNDVMVLDEGFFLANQRSDCLSWEVGSTFSSEQIDIDATNSIINKALNPTGDNNGLVFNQLFPKIKCKNWDKYSDFSRKMFHEKPSVDKLMSRLKLDEKTVKTIQDYAVLKGKGKLDGLTILAFVRHRAMISEIEEALSRYKKVFIVAGFNHIPHSAAVDRNGSSDDTELTQYELRAYLSNKNYVSLISKEEIFKN